MRSQLTQELLTKLDRNRVLDLNGLPRLPKGLLASTVAQQRQQPLLTITATLEETGRWATLHFYPTLESSLYAPNRKAV